MSEPTEMQIAAAQTLLKERHEQSRPVDSLIHRLATHVLPQFQSARMTVTLVNGDVYSEVGADLFYTDGLSIVKDGERIFFPLSAIASIKHLKNV